MFRMLNDLQKFVFEIILGMGLDLFNYSWQYESILIYIRGSIVVLLKQFGFFESIFRVPYEIFASI